MGWYQRGNEINGEAAGDKAVEVTLSADGNTLAVGAFGGDYVLVYVRDVNKKYVDKTWV